MNAKSNACTAVEYKSAVQALGIVQDRALSHYLRIVTSKEAGSPWFEVAIPSELTASRWLRLKKIPISASLCQLKSVRAGELSGISSESGGPDRH